MFAEQGLQIEPEGEKEQAEQEKRAEEIAEPGLFRLAGSG